MKKMRMRNNKLINFILEFSQILLVFLGVLSALMCTAASLGLSYSRMWCTLIMLAAAVLFYGLFTVLETFRKGKMYGILGITLFFFFIAFRFMGAVKKGGVSVINSFLKEFMNFTGTRLTLITYSDDESAGIVFCTTFLLLLIGVYLIAMISAFFYRRRRSMIFIALTVPFVVAPLAVGKVPYFSNLFTYLIVLVTVIGTRHLRTDATDRRMRQKLSLILMFVGMVVGAVSWIIIPPERYSRNEDTILQTKNSIIALSTWSTDDVLTWFKSYLNEDAIDYGKIGKKREVTRTGEILLKISGEVNENYGIYLKGYVGDKYEKNKWTSLQKEEDYMNDWAVLDSTGVTIDNWHAQLRNELGESETSGAEEVWRISNLRIRNIAFGYGNYLVPYLPTSSFEQKRNGKSSTVNQGIDYEVEYYSLYPVVLRQDLLNGEYRMAADSFWDGNEVERQKLKEFAQKYYLQVPESAQSICADFKKYIGNEKSQKKILEAVKNYIMRDTEYTLSPGKTPADKESIEYFLKENKKGYCSYYATAAAVLLRSVGIPTRYVEGMYISKEEMQKYIPDKEIEVLDYNAHAWIEVYDEKYGFVPMEVTPGIGEEDPSVSNNRNPNGGGGSGSQVVEEPEMVTPTPSVTEVPEESMTFDDIEGNEDDPEDDVTNSPEPTATVEGGGLPTTTEDEKTSSVGNVLLLIGLCIVITIVVMELQRRVRRLLFHRRLRKMDVKKRIRKMYQHLVPVFMKEGILYTGQTVSEYGRAIAKGMNMRQEDAEFFAELVFHARFGPDDISEEEMGNYRIVFNKIQAKAYAKAKIPKKIYYMYIMVL